MCLRFLKILFVPSSFSFFTMHFAKLKDIILKSKSFEFRRTPNFTLSLKPSYGNLSR